MSGRRKVPMDPDEVALLLGRSKNAVLTTLDRDGWPHSTAMWFIPSDGVLRMWTYRKSQKAVNLIRDTRCSVLVEEGEEYRSLRGVLIQGRARLIEDLAGIEAIGRDLFIRYEQPKTGIAYEGAPKAEVIKQARKRIGLEIPFDRVASWDHRKL